MYQTQMNLFPMISSRLSQLDAPSACAAEESMSECTPVQRGRIDLGRDQKASNQRVREPKDGHLHPSHKSVRLEGLKNGTNPEIGLSSLV